MNRWLDLIERLGLVILTFGVVIYILLASKFWVSDFQFYFFKAGDYMTFIYISLGILVFSWVLKKLLVWEIHSALGPKRRRRRH